MLRMGDRAVVVVDMIVLSVNTNRLMKCSVGDIVIVYDVWSYMVHPYKVYLEKFPNDMFCVKSHEIILDKT